MIYDNIQLEGIKKAEEYLLSQVQKRWDKRDKILDMALVFMAGAIITAILFLIIK